ncbi:MAG: cupin domain-containing protein [Peptococcales bacterium]
MIVKNDEKSFVPMVEGAKRKTLAHGEKTLLIQVVLDKGSLVPNHAHPHEQIGYMISGKAIFIIDGEENEVNPGDSWAIPGNVAHSVKVIEDSVIVEVFSPVREDYL